MNRQHLIIPWGALRFLRTLKPPLLGMEMKVLFLFVVGGLVVGGLVVGGLVVGVSFAGSFESGVQRPPSWHYCPV